MKRRHVFCAVLLAVLLVGLDNLVPRLDWAYINRNGWLMYFWLLIPWTALLLSPALLLGRMSRFLYYPLVTLIVMIETVTLFVRWQFKVQMDGSWVAIVLGSSPGEIMEFVDRYFGAESVFAASLVLAFLAFAWWIVSRLKGLKFSWRRVWLGIVGLGLFPVMTPFCQAPMETLESRSTVLFLTNALQKWRDYRALLRMKGNPQFPENVSRTSGVDDSVSGVFVIGESATRSRWHLYGYERPTTPCVESLGDSVLVFSNVTAAAVYTAQAIPLMMTSATLEKPEDMRYSFSQVLSALGFRVTLFSNQERMGKFSAPVSIVFDGCAEQVFLKETGRNGVWYDDAVLPYLSRELREVCTERPKVVFLQLMGSHVTAAERYPSDFTPFAATPMKRSCEWRDMAKMSGHYDNSIAFTDQLLGKVVAELQKQDGPTWMVYLPDHGDTPDAEGWRTVTSRQMWEVPMIVWLSPEYRRRFPAVVDRLKAAVAEPQRSDRLIDLFLCVAGVEMR